jgi:hypothetical protein
MGFDIRLPIGFMFAIFGALLGVFGVVTGGSAAAGSRGLHVNAWWGLVMLVFGLALLYLARRRRS